MNTSFIKKEDIKLLDLNTPGGVDKHAAAVKLAFAHQSGRPLAEITEEQVKAGFSNYNVLVLAEPLKPSDFESWSEATNPTLEKNSKYFINIGGLASNQFGSNVFDKFKKEPTERQKIFNLDNSNSGRNRAWARGSVRSIMDANTVVPGQFVRFGMADGIADKKMLDEYREQNPWIFAVHLPTGFIRPVGNGLNNEFLPDVLLEVKAPEGIVYTAGGLRPEPLIETVETVVDEEHIEKVLELSRRRKEVKAIAAKTKLLTDMKLLNLVEKAAEEISATAAENAIVTPEMLAEFGISAADFANTTVGQEQAARLKALTEA